MGHIWDIRHERMMANTSIGVQLLDVFYSSLACDLIRGYYPFFPGLLELLQDPDYNAEPSFLTTTKEADSAGSNTALPTVAHQ